MKMNTKKSQTVLKKSAYWISVIFLGAILGLSLQFAKAWTEPTVAPPNSNVGAPINTGSTAQTKNGNLSSTGNMSANDYYVVSIGKWVSQIASASGTYSQNSCYYADGGCTYGNWAYCSNGYFAAGMYMAGCDVGNMWWGHRFIVYCCK